MKFVFLIKLVVFVFGSGLVVVVFNIEVVILFYDVNIFSEYCRYWFWGYIYFKFSFVLCGLGVWFGVFYVVRYVSDDFGM